jgi:hypothetical protein
MATVIIAEKTSQAKDLRAALGARFGQILPAEGHLLRLANPRRLTRHGRVGPARSSTRSGFIRPALPRGETKAQS